MEFSSGSTPSISEFDPHAVPYQYEVIRSVRAQYDYTKGVQEILLSGSVGSAKSLLLAHLLVTHCLLYPKARALLGRQSMPDLKETLIQKVIEHIGDDLKEGEDYEYNKSTHKWTFDNGSELISRSWHDKNFKRFRSLELSAAGVEELTENSKEYMPFYFELFQRVGRLPHIKENWICSATNPDAPSHWAYKHFIANPTPNRHVYYSVTTDNKFLPASYIETLKSTLDPKMAQRMIYGQWIEIEDEVVYYAYKKDKNFRDEVYKFDPAFPVDLSFDFNIAENKPMSACVSQYVNGTFHFAKDFIVTGARTKDLLDEIASSGILNQGFKIKVFGDATGKSRDTRSIKSDYDIIREFLANYEPKLDFELLVPLANPPIRERHNIMNAQFLDANGQIKAYVYKEAATLDEGFRLTKLKKGANYIEDDKDSFQHVTTAASYMVHYRLKKIRAAKPAYHLL